MTNSSNRNLYFPYRLFSGNSVFSGFLAIILCFSVAITPRVQAQSIDVALPVDSLVTGLDTVHVPIKIGDVTGRAFNSFQFTISFDSTIVKIPSVLASGHLADGFLIIFNDAVGGRIDVAAAGGAALSGEGTLVTLSVVFIAEGSSNLEFEAFKFEPGLPELNLTNGRIRNISLASNEDIDPSLPNLISIEGNYPNPFRSATNIVMDLQQPAQVGIKIFNINGQLVRSIPKRTFQAGPNQSVSFDAASLSAGSYLYRIEAGSPGGVQYASGTMTIIN